MNWLKSLAMSAIAIIAPIQSILTVVSILILADTVTGIMAAYKRGEEINSKGFSRTISKLFLYNLLIILAFLMEKYIFDEFIPFVKIGAMVIVLTEFKSFVENFESITGIDLIKIKKMIDQKEISIKKDSEENKEDNKK